MTRSKQLAAITSAAAGPGATGASRGLSHSGVSTESMTDSQAGQRAAGSEVVPTGTTPRMSARQAGHVTVSYSGCGQSRSLPVDSGTNLAGQ